MIITFFGKESGLYKKERTLVPEKRAQGVPTH